MDCSQLVGADCRRHSPPGNRETHQQNLTSATMRFMRPCWQDFQFTELGVTPMTVTDSAKPLLLRLKLPYRQGCRFQQPFGR